MQMVMDIHHVYPADCEAVKERAKSTYGGGYSHKCDSLGVIIEPLYTYKKYKKVPYYIKDIKGE